MRDQRVQAARAPRKRETERHLCRIVGRIVGRRGQRVRRSGRRRSKFCTGRYGVGMSSVPDNIVIEAEGPDVQGRLRAFAMSGGREIGAATAVPDPERPGEWVISDMHFRDDEHWPSLGNTLLDKLVMDIERIAGTGVVITGSLDRQDFKDVLDAYRPRRIPYVS